jgi:hypothetical protein
MTRHLWTEQAIRDLGTFTSINTAAGILCLSRTYAYQLAEAGQFPVPVHKFGRRWKVPVAALLALAYPPADPNEPSEQAGDPT